MIKKSILILQVVLFLLPVPMPAAEDAESEIVFSRLIIYDVRGKRKDETAVILEQKGEKVRVWLKDYMGKRTGAVPYEEYRDCFETMRKIKKFALKKKYRGKLLRTNAAHGVITLAWQDKGGKQIETIKYYAPEHTLDDFRYAFNGIWALSRYAVLSLNSFENPRVEYLEDAVYFMSGAGWMTHAEIQSVVAFHHSRGHAQRITRSLWRALSQNYPAASEFSNRTYLEHCVKRGMIFMGDDAVVFLKKRMHTLTANKKKLANEILNTAKKK
ncbi:hypothetical protein K8S19_11320 [bacterium]|nr:hypothetical protein [bacterium]